MKNILKLFLIIVTTLTISCSSENNEESNRLFDKILEVTEDLDQFKGSAFVGNLKGDCYMFLKNGKKIDDDYEKIFRLRYGIDNYIQAKSDLVDATFTVNNLSIHRRDISNMGLKNPEKYANFYIKGKFKSLKNSVNNGNIEDGSGEGSVVFAIDSIAKTLNYVMSGTGNYSYQGNIKLNEKNHILIKKIFRDTISPEEEQKIIQSYNKLELITENLIKIDNSYKFLLSKKDILKNSRVKNNYDGSTSWSESNMNKLFSFEVKNISNDDYAFVTIGPRFYYGGKKTTEQDEMFWFTDDSSLFKAEYLENFKKGDSRKFTFNLRFKNTSFGDNDIFKSVCCDDEGHYIPHPLRKMSMEEIFNDEQFLSVLNKALKLPVIEFRGRKCLGCDTETFSTKIYFELVD